MGSNQSWKVNDNVWVFFEDPKYGPVSFGGAICSVSVGTIIVDVPTGPIEISSDVPWLYKACKGKSK